MVNNNDEFSLDDLWKSEIDFEEKVFPNWKQLRETYWSNALAGEVGELCNDTKKRRGGGTNNYKVTDDEILEEATDIFIYLILFVESSGFTLEDFREMLYSKMQKNWRRYEDGKVSKIEVE